MAAADPSHNVHEKLLPHIHLISTYRYATNPRVDISDVTKWLHTAPKIARDTAPFFWTFLDAPQDGTILLTWQPLNRLGTEFASDGYIWGAGETVYQQELGDGTVLETWYQQAGYRPGEQYATHSRRRFRLTPSKVAGQNTPSIDPSLWIVHYGPTDSNKPPLPIQQMPHDPRTQSMMANRMQLQRGGQIVRKDFMLADRGNWPQIPLPREGRGQALYAAPVNARGVPQQMAYPPGPSPSHPSKRARTGAQAPQQHAMGQIPQHENAYDDEEDTFRGDMFDLLTPREVSMARYRQNHEFLEQVISSPYAVNQIVHADLGLGLKGELSSLTDGIFDAPGSGAHEKASAKPYVGRLDSGLADEFRKRVAEKIDTTNTEIEQMKARHEKMLAKFKSNSVIKHAEHDLRVAVQETGPEFWRLEGRQEDGEEGISRFNNKHHKKVDEIVASVESALGRHAEVVHDVRRVQDGGYQEPAPEPEPVQPPPVAAELTAPSADASMSRQPSQSGSQNSGIMIGDSDIDMGGTAAGLLDQMHTGFSATSTPVNNFPTPQAHLSGIPSAAGTPADANVPSPAPAPAPETSGDVAMSGTEAPPAPPAPEVPAAPEATESPKESTTAPDQEAASGDWVVVPKGGVSPGASPNATTEAAAPAPVPAPAPAVEAPEPETATSKPTSAAPTPAAGDSESMAFDGDNNDFSSLGDLDSAGDALAGYDPPTLDGTPGGLGDSLDLDMDDSAFGDAFHGVNASNEGGDTPAEGGL